jgi:hypothetical protein
MLDWNRVKHISEGADGKTQPLSSVTPIKQSGINWDNVKHTSETVAPKTPLANDGRNRFTSEEIQRMNQIKAPETKTPLDLSRYNIVGQGIIPRYQEDKPITAIGKDVVNYGLGTAGRIIGSVGQAGMQLVSNIGNAVQGKPLDFSQKSLKQDILPKQYGQFVDTLANKGAAGQLASGFIQGATEGGLDPGTWIGGLGVLDDAARAGLIGKSASLGTTENVLSAGARQNKINIPLAPQSATRGYLNAERNATRAVQTPDVIYGQPTGVSQQFALPAPLRQQPFTQVKYSTMRQPVPEYVPQVDNPLLDSVRRNIGLPPTPGELARQTGADTINLVRRTLDLNQTRQVGEGIANAKSTVLPKKAPQTLFTENSTDRPFVKVQGKQPVPLIANATPKEVPPIANVSRSAGPTAEFNMASGIKKRPPNVKGSLGNFYRATVDNTYDVGKAAGEQGTIAANVARNAGGTVEYSLKNGLVNMEGKQIVDKGLREVYNLPKEMQQALNNLLLHRLNIDRLRQGKPLDPNITTAQSRQAIDDILARFPQLGEKEKIIRQTLDLLLDEWGVKSGLVSPELRDVLRNMYPDYVPSYRVMNGVDAISYKSRGMGPARIVNKAIGGDETLQILDESIPTLINKTIKAARKNEVYQTILNAARRDPANTYAKILTPANEAEAAIEKGITDGLVNSIRADGLEALATIGDNALQADPKFGYILTVMENGKPVRLSITKDLFDSLQGLSRVDDSALGNIAQKVKRFVTNPFKALVTSYNPLFAVRNIARDIPTAYIQGTENNPFRFFGNLGRAAKEMATDSPLYREYKALGGQGGNYFNVERNPLKPDTPLSGVKKVIGALNNTTETLPRLGEYIGTLRRGGEDYANKMRALYNAQEVTTNFGRHGDTTKAIDAFVPYLNPAVQGLDKFVRTMKKPVNIAKAVAFTTVPTAVFYGINQLVDKKGYDQLDNRTKDTYYLIPEGEGKFIKIPKTREAGVLFGALFERLARLSEGQENSFKGFGSTVATNFLPNNPITSSIAYPAAAAAFNWKDFAGRDIVPEGLNGFSPYLQYDAKTSEIAKKIGAAFNLSPKKIDYLVKSYTGIIGQAGIPLSTKSNYTGVGGVLSAPFTADALYNNEIQNDFYGNLDKAQMEKKDAGVTGAPYNENLTSGLSRTSNDLSTVRALMKQVEANPLIQNKQKQELLRVYQQRILDIAGRGNELAKSGGNTIESKYPELTGQYYPESSFTFNKVKYNLAPEEYEQYRTLSNDMFNQLYAPMALGNNVTDDIKERIIQNTMQKANEYAQYQILKQRGILN